MGAFFRSEYDLFSEIKEDPDRFFLKMSEALSIVDRPDYEDDVKDAITEISDASDFESAYFPTKNLFEILNDSIGVINKIKKRVKK